MRALGGRLHVISEHVCGSVNRADTVDYTKLEQSLLWAREYFP